MSSGSGVHGFAQAVLRTTRRRKGLSRSDLGLLLGTSAQTVAQWEAGATAPTPPHLTALAKQLGLLPDDLIRTSREDANLASLRERAGMTARAAADQVGLSRTGFSTVETGSAALSDAVAERMARAYGTSEAELHSAWERTVDERKRRINTR